MKNKINNVFLIISIFKEDGGKYGQKKLYIKDHNEISISNAFNLKKFKGIAHVEFFSEQNLRFPFPAISGFYISPKKLLSGVHSAGRILNPSEVKKKKISYEESNFSLKFRKGVTTPFFSFFNSPVKKKNNKILITLRDSTKKLIEKIIIKNKILKPFQNEIFYLENYFCEKSLSKSYYATIKIDSNDTFPRLICGNYHKKLHHFEVTHSYGVVKSSDYIKNHHLQDKKVEHMSIMPFIKPKELKLKLRMFPTSLKAKLSADVYILDEGSKKIKFREKLNFDPSFKALEYNINDKVSFGFMTLKQKKIPARLNTTYIYSNDNNLNLSTDIAAGFKSIDYPIKRNHWGSVWAAKNINAKILIRRTTFYKDKSLSKGTLKIYGKNNFFKKIKLSLKNNDYKIVDINKFINLKNNQPKSFSWMLNIEQNPSGVETFWTSYNGSFICGEHGF